MARRRRNRFGECVTVHYTDDQVTLHHGDALNVARDLVDGSANCIVTSPPYYGLRDYGTDGQYGLEASPAEYVETMRALFAELRRVLSDDGVLWLNLGDSYANNSDGYRRGDRKGSEGNQPHVRPKHRTLPFKNLMGIPWRVAFALQDDGWILRNDVIWHKPNAMPASVDDRLSTRYEHVFLFSKARFYWFDLDPIREAVTCPETRGERGPAIAPDSTTYAPGMKPQAGRDRTGSRRKYLGSDLGRNPGDVWAIPTSPFAAAHFAVMPPALAHRCIASGCKPGGTVLDPFSGSGTTGLVAQRLGRKYVGIDLNAEYLDLSLKTRLHAQPLDFGEGA
jgi:DNA modification methylase